MSLLVKKILCVCLLLTAVTAQARIYKHIDRMTGVVIYSNFPPSAKKPNKAVASALYSTATYTPKTALFKPHAPAALAIPANFPRVTDVIQKKRDIDRRKILMDELETEQSALAEALEKKAEEETIHRHEANIAALQREISNIR